MMMISSLPECRDSSSTGPEGAAAWLQYPGAHRIVATAVSGCVGHLYSRSRCPTMPQFFADSMLCSVTLIMKRHRVECLVWWEDCPLTIFAAVFFNQGNIPE